MHEDGAPALCNGESNRPEKNNTHRDTVPGQAGPSSPSFAVSKAGFHSVPDGHARRVPY